MRTLRDEAAIAALPDAALRRLLEKRVAEIEESCPWDADEVGYFIVIEPGDTVDVLEAEIGFSVLRNRIDDTPFGHPDFVPSFEWAAIHPEGYIELVYVISDSGYGYDILIADQPDADPNLIAMCRAFATPTA